MNATVRRRFHEIAGRPDQRAPDAAIHRELGAAHGVDHDAGGIRRVPDLELHLSAERHAAEGGTLEADVGALAILQPRHVIARADMDVSGRERHVELAGHGLRLGDFLRRQPFALEHVLEV
jgi:hypothetical protein